MIEASKQMDTRRMWLCLRMMEQLNEWNPVLEAYLCRILKHCMGTKCEATGNTQKHWNALIE